MKRGRFKSNAPLLAAFLMLPGILLGGEIPVVINGKAEASIVIPEKATPRELRAAEQLQEYVKRASGAKLPISSKAGNGPSIYVGATDQGHRVESKGLDEDGYILKGINDRSYCIVGGSDWGTEYGVYELLERYLGVRWLMPTELGTVVPKRASISLPTEEIREEPVFLNRRLSPIDVERTTYEKKSPFRQYRFFDEWGKSNRLRKRLEFHHNLLNLFLPSLYAKTHPEFYPLINGERKIPKNDRDFWWQPNFSAEGIADEAIRRIDTYFEENPERKSYSLAVNDPRMFDESPASKARRSGKRNSLNYEDISDDYMQWANAVAEGVRKRFPDRQFGFLAYSNIFDPPQREDVTKGLVPFLTYERLAWGDKTAREWDQGNTLKWAAKAPELGWYDYIYGMSYLVPRQWPHLMKEYLQWGAAHRVRYYAAELYPNWGEGPQPWITSKLIWNPNRDVDALIKDWCVNAVGEKAAPKLAEYYSIWETFWSRDLPSKPRTSKDIEPLWFRQKSQWLPFLITTYLLAVPDEYVERSDRLMNEAVALAETREEKARAGKLQQMWQIYKASVLVAKGDNLWRKNQPATEAEALDLLARCKETARQAAERYSALEALRDDDLHGHSVYRILLTPDTAGAAWGTTSLWTLLPWIGKSDAVRKQLEELGREAKTKASQETVRKILKTAEQPGKGILENPSFEAQLEGWRTGGIAWLPEGVAQLTGKGNTVLGQTCPVSTGEYYARLKARLPEGAEAKGVAALRMRTVTKDDLDTGRELPSMKLPLTAGEWREVIVPFEIGDNLANRPGLKLVIDLSLEDWPKGVPLQIDDFQVYRVE